MVTEKVTFGRMKHGQTRLVPVKRTVSKDEMTKIRRIASQLHEVYKKYKVGIIKDEDLTPKQRALLRKYYGVR